MLCLGLESSCDETALALVEDGRLVAAVLASQADVHALFGGVVPELASREHYRYVGALYDALLRRSGRSGTDIDGIAVSRGPGLLGSLLVGVAFAKGLALGLGCPLLGINHLHAHLLAVGLEQPLPFPALGLLVSGGHTNLYRMEAPWRFQPLGRTLDDAAGEAFDKVGKVLGLGYPAGHCLDILARSGDAHAMMFPRPYLDNATLDFSFSGLKTAVAAYAAQHFQDAWPRPWHLGVEEAPQVLRDCCASFNLAVVDTLCVKAERALDRHPDVRTFVVAGGVAANSMLREHLSRRLRQRGVTTLVPRPALCTDNAAMVAYAGWLLQSVGYVHDLHMEAIPRGRAIPDDARCVPKGRMAVS